MKGNQVIDMHVHVYPDAIAVHVAEKIGLDFDVRNPSRLTTSGIVAAQRRANIRLSVNLPVATSAKQVSSVNAWVKRLPEGIMSFAALYPKSNEAVSELNVIRSAGFKGVKFHPEFQNFRLDDPTLFGLWEEMSALGLIAYFHAGGDRSFEAPYHTTPESFRVFRRRFPRLPLVAAHLGGYKMWDESEAVLCGEDLYLDLSHTFDFAPQDQILRMIRKHGVERILFATDSPWREPEHELGRFMSLPLDESEREQILHLNAERLLGVEGFAE